MQAGIQTPLAFLGTTSFGSIFKQKHEKLFQYFTKKIHYSRCLVMIIPIIITKHQNPDLRINSVILAVCGQRISSGSLVSSGLPVYGLFKACLLLAK
ncbi:hypothetical protein [Methylomicrobium sp. Wu6]|uniref:hypothetical protein n=1 Tax=Methylomicrobium sp. Wu6 TaxID=3107928 RepID=UPI002DD6294F|nr:hypothetical protein [Methylomicrobium sp. Wu6]MEC4749855.1 hypothetical protein [Methylomicrobium sp. Wu6]